MQNFVNLAISGSRISEPREINNDVEGSDFDIVSLSFIRHGLMFANTNVGQLKSVVTGRGIFVIYF